MNDSSQLLAQLSTTDGILALLPTLAELAADLSALELVIARDADREIHEGRLHAGPSATVQLVARRPSA